MDRFSPWFSLVLVLSSNLISAQVSKGPFDLRRIPVKVELDSNFQSRDMNKPFTVTVTLKNSRGETVPAVKAERVDIHYQEQRLQATIAPGQTSASFQITPHNVGVWKIEVSGQDVAGAKGFVECTDSKKPLRKVVIAPLSSAAGPRPQTTGTGTPVAAPAPLESLQFSLRPFIRPNPVNPNPETGLWQAQIALALMGPNNELVGANQDLPLHLLADVGQLTPADLVLKKDQSSTFSAPVTLISKQPGPDVIHVLSGLPEVQQSVTYQSPQPAGFRLEASPPSVVNDGKTPVHIAIMLLAADNTLVKTQANEDITLRTTRGTLPPIVTIHSGEYFSTVDLTSAQNGQATVTAQAPGLLAGEISATFLFPWMMIILAGLGGALGAIVNHPKGAFSREGWRALLLGLICGVVFSTAALFGLIGALPKLDLPVQASNIPSLNTLGALLLGFIGGFYGKKLWLKGGSGDGPEPGEKASGQRA